MKYMVWMPMALLHMMQTLSSWAYTIRGRWGYKGRATKQGAVHQSQHLRHRRHSPIHNHGSVEMIMLVSIKTLMVTIIWDTEGAESENVIGGWTWLLKIAHVFRLDMLREYKMHNSKGSSPPFTRVDVTVNIKLIRIKPLMISNT